MGALQGQALARSVQRTSSASACGIEASCESSTNDFSCTVESEDGIMVVETHFVFIAGIIVATLVAVLTVGIEHWRKGKQNGKQIQRGTVSGVEDETSSDG